MLIFLPAIMAETLKEIGYMYIDISVLSSITIDHVICLVALLAIFAVGIKSAGKIKGLEDYALSSGHKFSTPVLAMTMIVTMIGGNASMGAIAETYSSGIIFTLSDFMYLIGPFLLIQYAAKFISGHYSGEISLYGIIDREYGMWPAKLASVVSVFLALVSVAMQMMGMAYLAKSFLDIPFYLGLAGTSFIFVIYSSISGIRGVVYTDVVQFFVILVIFPILAGIIVYKIGGVDVIFSQLPETKLQVVEHPDALEYLFLTLFWMMPFGLFWPSVIQRFLMCESGKELKQMGISWVLFHATFMIVTGIIGLASISLLPNLTSGKEVIPALMQEYFPVGIKGLALTAFFAVIMSTADSGLNAATVLVVEIFMPEEERHKHRQRAVQTAKGGKLMADEADIKQVSWFKLCSFALGGLAFLLALLDFSFVKGMTIASALAFGAVNIPIFFAPFKDKGVKAKRAYWGSVIGGFVVFLLLLVLLGQERIYMVSFFSAFFSIAGWFIGATMFDKTKTTFWRDMKGAYGFKQKVQAIKVM
jgi:SSS family solute:Na+ symporter